MEYASGVYKDLIFPHGANDPGQTGMSFEKAMLDVSPDCIKVISVTGNLVTMNKAGCLALGVPLGSGFGMPWLPLLPDTIHAAGELALEKARNGEPARFNGESRLGDDVRYWDNLLTPILDSFGNVGVILCVSRDVTSKTVLEKALEQALLREQTLAQEMRHRIKNIFSVSLGLVSLAKREAARDNNPGKALELLSDKLAAFSRASDSVFGHGDTMEGDDGTVLLEGLIEAVLDPYAEHCLVAGEPCRIPRHAGTALVLVLHELATNAIKYGSLSTEIGEVHIDWRGMGDEVLLSWEEVGGPAIDAAPSHQGFGSIMASRSFQSVGGTVTHHWRPAGLVVEMRLPAAA